jgi:hypothetical protein
MLAGGLTRYLRAYGLGVVPLRFAECAERNKLAHNGRTNSWPAESTVWYGRSPGLQHPPIVLPCFSLSPIRDPKPVSGSACQDTDVSSALEMAFTITSDAAGAYRHHDTNPLCARFVAALRSR